VNIDYFPAAAWPTCVKHTDTNSAGRSAATGCFSGKGLPAGRVISGAPPHDGALPSRTARARFFFLRLRNAISARVLTGTELNAVSPATMRTDDVTGFRLQLPPPPPRQFTNPSTRARLNHTDNHINQRKQTPNILYTNHLHPYKT